MERPAVFGRLCALVEAVIPYDRGNPQAVTGKDAVATARVPIHNVTPSADDDDPAEDTDAAQYRESVAKHVLQLNDVEHGCDDPFNCNYQIAIRLETSRALAPDERLEVDWYAVGLGEHALHWDLEPELTLANQLFGSTE